MSNFQVYNSWMLSSLPTTVRVKLLTNRHNRFNFCWVMSITEAWLMKQLDCLHLSNKSKSDTIVILSILF